METLDHYIHGHNVYDQNGKQVKPDKPPYKYIPADQQGMVQKAAGDVSGRGDTLAKQIEDAGG